MTSIHPLAREMSLKNIVNPILVFDFLGELDALGGSKCLYF
jgi:hypothetical protein